MSDKVSTAESTVNSQDRITELERAADMKDCDIASLKDLLACKSDIINKLKAEIVAFNEQRMALISANQSLTDQLKVSEKYENNFCQIFGVNSSVLLCKLMDITKCQPLSMSSDITLSCCASISDQYLKASESTKQFIQDLDVASQPITSAKQIIDKLYDNSKAVVSTSVFRDTKFCFMAAIIVLQLMALICLTYASYIKSYNSTNVKARK